MSSDGADKEESSNTRIQMQSTKEKEWNKWSSSEGKQSERERDKGGGQADRLMDVERKSKKGKKMKIGSKRFRLKGQVYEQVKHPVLEQEMCSRIHLSHATNIKTKYRRKQKAAEQGRCALSHKQENK